MLNGVLALVLMLSTIGYTVGSAYCSMALENAKSVAEQSASCCCESSCDDEAQTSQDNGCCENTSQYVSIKTEVLPLVTFSMPALPVVASIMTLEENALDPSTTATLVAPQSPPIVLSAGDNCARTSNFRI